MANESVIDHTHHDGPQDSGRRRFLTATTAVVGAVGAGFVAVPFIKSWFPSEQAKSAGAPIKVPGLTELAAGTQLVIKWRGKPIFIAKRSPQALQMLPQMDPLLQDPKSTNAAQQPAYAQNEYRSIKPEILVIEGVCTHLGCAPELHAEVRPQPFDPDWKGGYFCPCHKSRYDLAGRVFKAQPAPANLAVPPYRFIDDDTVEIGVDAKGAA